MLVVRDVTSMAPADWDYFIDNHRVGTIFHKSLWLNILAETHSLGLKKVGFFEDGALVGVLPFFIKKIWPLRVAASPFVVENSPYMGLVIEETSFFEALVLLELYMKKNGIHYFRILQREKVHDLMRQTSFKLLDKHTHLLNLTKSEDEIWKSFEGRCRTAVRKAEKDGVIIKHKACREDLEGYYSILDNLYAVQKKATPNSAKLFYRMWDELADNQLHLLTAWHDETMIAGAMVIHDRERCYYLNGASLPDYNRLCPNNLIQWEAIRLAKSLGAAWYDFVGSDIERLAKFKKSFGGELMTYSCLEKASSKWVSFLRQKYPMFKSLMGRIKKRIDY